MQSEINTFIFQFYCINSYFDGFWRAEYLLDFQIRIVKKSLSILYYKLEDCT